MRLISDVIHWCFQVIFFDDELIGGLCELMDERAAQCIADNCKIKDCMNGIIWHPVTPVYIFLPLPYFYSVTSKLYRKNKKKIIIKADKIILKKTKNLIATNCVSENCH